jgi:hypothetical protein
MYKRAEQIEEENLNWEGGSSEETHALASKKSTSNPQTSLQLSLQNRMAFIAKILNFKKLNDFIDDNTEIALLFAVVVFPFVVGFCFSYALFYLYGGVPMSGFLEMGKNHTVLEMWSIGAYVFITILAVMAVFAP